MGAAYIGCGNAQTPLLVASASVVAAGTLTAPSESLSSDLAILIISVGGTSTPHALPSGWTNIGSLNETNEATMRMCYKSGPANVTISGGDVCALMLVFRDFGTFPGTTFTATLTSSGSSLITHPAPTFTPGAHNRTLGLVLSAWCFGGGWAGTETVLNPAVSFMREKTIVVSRVGAAIVAMFSWAQKQGASAGLFGSVGAATFTGQMLSGLEADVVMNTIFIEGNGAA